MIECGCKRVGNLYLENEQKKNAFREMYMPRKYKSQRETTVELERDTEIFGGMKDDGSNEIREMYRARSFAGQIDILLENKKMKQEDVCKRADISPRDLTRKKSDPQMPDGSVNKNHREITKDEVIKIAMGLTLDLNGVNRLLDAADKGALKPIRKRDKCILEYYDRIVEYFVENIDNPDVYNPEIENLNEELKKRGEKSLFGGLKYGEEHTKDEIPK